MLNEIPKHVAVIMDGNGRWARSKGFPRIKGHEEGVRRVEEIVKVAAQKGIRYLTLYTFSKENWRRPKEEVNFLMGLLSRYLDEKINTLIEDNVVLNVIGEMSDLPETIQKKLRDARKNSERNTGLTLTLALSYSSRAEILRAIKKIADRVKKQDLDIAGIDESLVNANLDTAGIPDPELLIRTSGEMRISNFLLWQISYAELYVTPKFWPEFTSEEFEKAIDEYRRRERRFGATEPARGLPS
ncbi:MAG: Ditrans,polycis-undecaprenyl-diphosphate synthase ((2E,6E)-farnesyl-diphosphate specific) [Candidatus Omnitrophica bacterium ADurb.Bin292]|jgi:undecaprenyl diphosphate synthase|nr:MAG: Ditrans,polycis-undecaprenyl-diphosphate synthase ((2E,6E)-farnesyl-diphosphate specific) [Candidatus Omnitrophica bacterium ADurb.Bin292]HPW76595.1 isoprenyl transferase [Candidatus Omnitrophota bacterium]HQB11410.1 isoprenyl transferase [Candidatus Omnitrophota bacterium]